MFEGVCVVGGGGACKGSEAARPGRCLEAPGPQPILRTVRMIKVVCAKTLDSGLGSSSLRSASGSSLRPSCCMHSSLLQDTSSVMCVRRAGSPLRACRASECRDTPLLAAAEMMAMRRSPA